ncbi:CBO0543 family protein [Paenibacillus hexagrammi]|uniref:Uncharacterized protein n=1 Tax=Paenibacillus hexagrammi TaxID=2908839 RepID=A0ABY3SIA4_9BACL|nr:CBO0543 family protein [Paenibacillus sp. YPD9-1]UJF33513.1 hypothetical protein L0M14_29115 [Paenibacillus sp. YPD9-1]
MDDRIYLYLVWGIGIILFISAVPRGKRRVAQIAFLFKQFLTWILGLIVVEFDLIEYPVRFFASVNRSSFTFEYFAYPCICAVFNSRYPEGRSIPYKLVYFAAYTSAMTLIEWMIERNSTFIEYIHWSWYWTWLSLFITFGMSRAFTRWFFHVKHVPQQREGVQ